MQRAVLFALLIAMSWTVPATAQDITEDFAAIEAHFKAPPKDKEKVKEWVTDGFNKLGEFEKAWKDSADEGENHFYLGRAYVIAGNIYLKLKNKKAGQFLAKALGHFKAFLKTNPDHEECKEMHDSLDAAFKKAAAARKQAAPSGGAAQALSPIQKDAAAVGNFIKSRPLDQVDYKAWYARAIKVITAFNKKWMPKANEGDNRVYLAANLCRAAQLDTNNSVKLYIQAAKALQPLVKAQPNNTRAKQLYVAIAKKDGLLAKARVKVLRRQIQAVLAKHASMQDKPAPELELDEVIDGDPVTLADFEGKVVVLGFFSSVKENSRDLLSKLVDLKVNNAGDVEVVGVTKLYKSAFEVSAEDKAKGAVKEKLEPDAERELLRKLADAYELNFPIALGEKTLKNYFAFLPPQVVVIDRAGTVRMVKAGKLDMKAIDEVVGKCVSGEIEDAAPPTKAGE